PGHPITAYGGGFGGYPNDHYFIHKGVVFSNRNPKPSYPELKRAYQWISVKAKEIHKGLFTIKNKYQFLNLDRFRGKWVLSEDGDTIAMGSFNPGSIKPGKEKDIRIPFHYKPKPGSDYFLRISFDLR